MVRLSRRELDLISHPAFQRLFEIYQLGQTHLVYRGATHTRGEHAIGTVDVAREIIEAIERTAPSNPSVPSEHWEQGPRLSEEEIAFVRLGALLHDIGHLPAGHTLEDELGLLARHDARARIELILDKHQWRGVEYPSLRELIDDKYKVDADAVGLKDGKGRQLKASEVLTLLISTDYKEMEVPADAGFRVGVCRDIIGNTICADLIDYLHRDWLHLGKPRHFDPRLLDYMRIVSRRDAEGRRNDRLVIHLGAKSRPRPDAVTAILDLLESRYQLAEIALFHRVKLAAAGMLERIVAELRDTFLDEAAREAALDDLALALLECSDLEVLSLLEKRLSERRSEASKPERVDGAIDLAQRLRVRRLHRDLYVGFFTDLGESRAGQIADRFSGEIVDGGDGASAAKLAAENRLKALRLLEESFALPPCSIAMYCPPRSMNSKIAEVGIFSKGVVGSLNVLDKDDQISGGHLSAQQARFRRLWRISFAINRDQYDRLEELDLLDLLCETIEKSTLWTPQDFGASADDDVRKIAQTLVEHEAFPWYQHEIIEPALNRQQASLQSPGGAPSVISFIGQKRKKT